MNQIIGYLLGFGLLIAGLFLEGDPKSFFNMPSVVVCVGGVFFFALAAHTPGALGAAVVAALVDRDISKEDARRHTAVLDTLTNLSYTMGVVGLLIGFVQMLQKMDDPKAIGPATAVALLTVLYGTILGGLIFGPLRYRVQLKVSEVGKDGA